MKDFLTATITEHTPGSERLKESIKEAAPQVGSAAFPLPHDPTLGKHTRQERKRTPSSGDFPNFTLHLFSAPGEIQITQTRQTQKTSADGSILNL